MSQSDSQEYAGLNKRGSDSHEYTDLNKLARRFLETNADSYSSSKKIPSRAYVKEVIEGIWRGENTECPICLESADDPDDTLISCTSLLWSLNCFCLSFNCFYLSTC